jgi:hypothetical protein
MGALAEALAATGDFDRAEAVVRSITHPNLRALALAELADALRAAGDFDRAEAVVRSITRPKIRASMLVNLAAAAGTARAKIITEAEAAARLITDSDMQAHLLTRLASLSTGITADRLIATAFRLTTWTSPLSALATRHSAVLIMLAAEVGVDGRISST